MQRFRFIVALLALGVMTAARGLTVPAGGAAASGTAPGAVAVEALVAEAIKDVEAFSKRLDGKTITLEGKVREIRGLHVFLVGVNQKDTNGDGIDCSFTEETPAMLAQIKALKVGDTVRVTGDFLAATLFAMSPKIDFYMCSKVQVVGVGAGSQPATTKAATNSAAAGNR